LTEGISKSSIFRLVKIQFQLKFAVLTGRPHPQTNLKYSVPAKTGLFGFAPTFPAPLWFLGA
jgi:hypothetical protein